MRRSIAVLASLLFLVPAAAARADAPCARGDAATAARALYGAELVRTERVAGLRTALALEPRIAPGTRRRMVAAGDGWCDAAAGFNRAWRGSTSRAAAIAYASLAAAPYFDGVTVREARETAPGVFALTTHARTNGVVARWVVAVDGDGVRSATWKATAFAQRPFSAELEGLTALPGASETYRLTTGGLLRSERGLPTARAAAAPEAPVQYAAPDGMTIHVSLGDSRVAVDHGQATGLFQADIVGKTKQALAHNYEEFLRWGLAKGWEAPYDAVLGPDHGFVYINDALSLYCFACVFIADDFQIHIVSTVLEILGALGYTYPDAEKAYLDVIGHEMFHNFQNRYVKPGALGETGGPRSSTAYSEGTARFQETLHDYADVSFQPGSLFYAGDANGCNGFDGGASMDDAMASGLFDKGYENCFFWSHWYAAYGKDALLNLVRREMPKAAPTSNVHEEGLAALAGSVPAVPVADQLARFGAMALTGDGLSWASWEGGPVRPWGAGLDRWKPAVLAPGASAAATIANGGQLARELKQGATVALSGSSGAALYAVRDGSAGLTTTRLPLAGGAVAAPAADDRVWVLGLFPRAGTARLTLKAT